MVLSPTPPSNPFSRGVANGGVVPLVAACQTVSAEAEADRRELASLPRGSLRQIRDLAEIGEARFIERVLAEAERAAYGPGRSERAVVADSDVARAVPPIDEYVIVPHCTRVHRPGDNAESRHRGR